MSAQCWLVWAVSHGADLGPGPGVWWFLVPTFCFKFIFLTYLPQMIRTVWDSPAGPSDGFVPRVCSLCSSLTLHKHLLSRASWNCPTLQRNNIGVVWGLRLVTLPSLGLKFILSCFFFLLLHISEVCLCLWDFLEQQRELGASTSPPACRPELY